MRSHVRPRLPHPFPQDLDALLGLNLASSSPLFCYLAAGRLLVLAHYQYVAVFHAILFFLQYHKVRTGRTNTWRRLGAAATASAAAPLQWRTDG